MWLFAWIINIFLSLAWFRKWGRNVSGWVLKGGIEWNLPGHFEKYQSTIIIIQNNFSFQEQKDRQIDFYFLNLFNFEPTFMKLSTTLKEPKIWKYKAYLNWK